MRLLTMLAALKREEATGTTSMKKMPADDMRATLPCLSRRGSPQMRWQSSGSVAHRRSRYPLISLAVTKRGAAYCLQRYAGTAQRSWSSWSLRALLRGCGATNTLCFFSTFHLNSGALHPGFLQCPVGGFRNLLMALVLSIWALCGKYNSVGDPFSSDSSLLPRLS